MLELRSGTSTATLDDFPLEGGNMDPPRPLPVHVTPTSEDDIRRDRTNDEDEQVNASPRRPRRPNAPDLEDALTRFTQTVKDGRHSTAASATSGGRGRDSRL